MSSVNKKLFFDTPIHLIQQVRLIHSLAETSIPICVPPSEYKKLEVLKRKFKIKSLQEKGDKEDMMSLSQFIFFKHDIPITQVGNLSRNLIFPHQITRYCKTLWRKKRKYRFLFIGFLTAERKQLIDTWLYKNFPTAENTINLKDNFIFRVKRKIVLKFNLNINLHKKIGDFVITSSIKGRSFPGKSWDENYYKNLSNSKFVLCPAGDFTWSYRFFESILCGAIPVVESDCDVYKGFIYYKIEDSAEDFCWNENDANFNYNLCVEKITIPIKKMENELIRYID